MNYYRIARNEEDTSVFQLSCYIALKSESRTMYVFIVWFLFHDFVYSHRLSVAVILIPFLYFPLVLPLCFSTILFILRFVRLFLYVYECGKRRGWHTRRRKIRSKRVTIPELMGFQLFIFHNQFFYIYFHFFFLSYRICR